MDVMLEATRRQIMRKKKPNPQQQKPPKKPSPKTITTPLCLENAHDLNGKNREIHCE